MFELLQSKILLVIRHGLYLHCRFSEWHCNITEGIHPVFPLTISRQLVVWPYVVWQLIVDWWLIGRHSFVVELLVGIKLLNRVWSDASMTCSFFGGCTVCLNICLDDDWIGKRATRGLTREVKIEDHAADTSAAEVYELSVVEFRCFKLKLWVW